MIIKTFIEPPIENNNYLVIDEYSKEAVLIDCSCGIEEDIAEDLNSKGIKLKYILLTHGHFDHISGLKHEFNTPIYMHSADQNWVDKVNTYLPMVGLPTMVPPKITEYIDENTELSIGNNKIKVIHTPGHTQGGVCFLIDNNLFSGDTIFKESVGRCDLEGGNFDQIVDSIQQKIFTLDPQITIYPGHGKKTTIEWEKCHNRFL